MLCHKNYCDCCGRRIHHVNHEEISYNDNSRRLYPPLQTKYFSCEECKSNNALPVSESIERYLIMGWQVSDAFISFAKVYFRHMNIALTYRNKQNKVARKYEDFVTWILSKDERDLRKFSRGERMELFQWV